jgi:hypothetical protein
LEKFWASIYRCEGTSEPPLEWVEHQGLRWSVYQQQRQVAAVVKNRWVTGNGNQYQIGMNHDADMPLSVAMVLAINTARHDDQNDSTITYEFRRVLPDARPWDESWTPS